MSLMKEIDTTEKELAYRNKHFHDIRVVTERQIVCASCGNNLTVKSGNVFSHPLLGILQCETCRKHFKSINETSEERSYCYICGHRKKLYVCSIKDCPSAFCKYCIKRNSTLSLLNAEQKDWKCFVCKSKPLWELRAVCAAIIDALPKRCNRSNIFQKRTLPSEREKIEKVKRLQRSLRAVCDEEDSNSEPRPSFMKSTKEASNQIRRPPLLEITVMNSSDSASETEVHKPEKVKKVKKAKPHSRDSSNSSRASVSKSAVNRKAVSKKNRDSSDSDNGSDVSQNETAKKAQKKSHNRSTEKRESRRNHAADAADSDSDEDRSTSRVSRTVNSSSKQTMQQNKKKDVNSRNTRTAKNKVIKYHDSTSESDDEDVEHTKQNRKKHAESRTLSRNSNEEQKRDRRDNSKRQPTEKIREDNSDSSSKEFQKEKLLKSKYSSVRQLKDLNVDYTKSPAVKNSSSEKTQDEKDDNEQVHVTFDNVKEVVKECKSICASFQKYIEVIEELYEKEDEEKLIVITAQKVNKIMTALSKKQKNLTTYRELWSKRPRASKSVPKKVQKKVSDDERSSEESKTHMECETHENTPPSPKNERNKKVSECDSEEIFSADESRSSRKMSITRDADTSKKDNNRIASDSDETYDKDEQQTVNKSNGEKSRQNSRDASPVLGTSEQKNTNAEGLNKPLIPECADDAADKVQSEDKNTDPKDDQSRSVKPNDSGNKNGVEHSPAKETNGEKTTLQDNNVRDSPSAKNLAINESIDDMFNDSFDFYESAEDMLNTREAHVETNNDQAEDTLKTKSTNDIEVRESSLRDKAECAATDTNNEKASSPGRNEKEMDAASCNDLEEVASASGDKGHDVDNNDLRQGTASGETDFDDVETAEELAKRTLLESDSITSSDSLRDMDPVKESRSSIVDDSKKDKTKDVDSDSSTVNSSRSSGSKSSSNDLHITAETDAGNNKSNDKPSESNDKSSKSDDGPWSKSNDKLSKSNDEPSKETRDRTSNSSDEDEDVKAEKAAKKALLTCTTSDDSEVSPSQESKKIAADNKKSELDVNIKAKKALLASSSESSSSDVQTSEIETKVADNDKKNNKRKHEPNSEPDTMVSAAKRKKLNLHKNHYYMNDEKLRMACEVDLKRLSKKVLKRYSYALQKSKQYLEHKQLKSLVDLDKLEKRYKSTRKDSDTSSDDASSKISKRSNKGKGKQAKEAEESLMDHLKRVENDDLPDITMAYSSDESVKRLTKVDTGPVSNEALMSEANKVAKQNLLNSSDTDAEKVITSDDDNNTSHDEKSEKKEDKKKKSQKKPEGKASKQNEDKKEKNEKSSWRRSKLLTTKFSDTESEDEKKKWEKKQEKIKKDSDSDIEEESQQQKKKKKKKKSSRRIFDSDSDVKVMDSDSDDSSDVKISSSASVVSLGSVDTKKKKEKLKRRGRKRRDSKSSDTDSSIEEMRPKPKRKRIKKMASDSDSSDEVQTSQGTPGKSGRKNIRKVLKDKQVAEDTKQAAKEEEERLKRIAERQALYNEMYEMRLAGEEKLDKLVLDFDTETKEELVSVHEDLVKRLKPHQAQGIKFMWDASFESLERIKNTPGSGCIIAHCMGLGKTLQVIALTHTLLTHETTDIKTILIVCPLSTVLNWTHEYKTWLTDLDDDVNVYELTKFKKNFERKYQLQRWHQTGGVMIIGYEMFRNLAGTNKKNMRKGMKDAMLECLVNPGPDLIVCDEGHLLKNEDTALSKCIRTVKTMRRIVLTGTPLQNNLTEYHCMVQFVKPNLLGTKKEFLNRFVNPITNGQFDDSTPYDVKLMKKRAHVLHKMLEGSVQRFDYSVLTPFLPPKQEYVIFVRLTETQIKMYQYYLANLARRHHGSGGSLFADFQALQRVWTHPIVLRLNAEKIERANEKKDISESEGSLKDFINDDTTATESSSSESNNDSDIQVIDAKDPPKRKTRNNPGEEEEPEPSPNEAPASEVEWWAQFVQPEHFEEMKISAKLLLLFGILKESEQIGDKVLVFSQSLYSLSLIEAFLGKIDDETQKGSQLESLDNHTGSWSLGLDYFRLDGQTSTENRSAWCRIFNRPTNTRARLFLISTRAGGLGINLTAANRVIIFDASWNPSHDVQSIFRIYRFGQKKPCYVYRFLAAGTMEEKIYNRQVTKLSLSCRVVDEQQIERHYSNHDLNELYMFEPYNTEERPTLNLPKDRLLAEIFLKCKDAVENYHEHDSLLENKAEEELDEEERKQAWLEYEEEKKGKPPLMMVHQNNMLQQQYNMMMNVEQSGMLPPNVTMQQEYQNLQQLICKDYPNITPEQQKLITNRALMDMYNYWERQALLQPVRNPVQLPTYQPRIPPLQATTSGNTHQQMNQMATVAPMNYMNINQPAQTGVNLLPKQFPYRNAPTNNTGKDIIEMIPTTTNSSTLNTQAAQAVQPAATNKNQEE